MGIKWVCVNHPTPLADAPMNRVISRKQLIPQIMCFIALFLLLAIASAIFGIADEPTFTLVIVFWCFMASLGLWELLDLSRHAIQLFDDRMYVRGMIRERTFLLGTAPK